MNGTSMAAPNVAGNLALIISGLKQLDLSYSPFSIERSVKTTAAKMPDHCHFSSGAGLIQCLKSFEHLKEFSPRYPQMNHTFFRVSTEKSTQRGTLLHKKSHFNTSVYRPTVTVAAKWTSNVDSEVKCDFALSLALVSSHSWVSVPSYFYLTNNSRAFVINIDTSQLKPGAHYAEVLGYDEKNFAYGPVFRHPITVLKPLNENLDDKQFSFDSLSLTPGALVRRFFRPPAGCSFVTVKLTSLTQVDTLRLCLHLVSMNDCMPHADQSQHRQVFLEPTDSRSFNLIC